MIAKSCAMAVLELAALPGKDGRSINWESKWVECEY